MTPMPNDATTRSAPVPAFRLRTPRLLLAAALLLSPALFAQDSARSGTADTADSEGADLVSEAGLECAAEDDFPTPAVADYVLGCMAANGNTYEALQQCSCSIDFIKARMSYKEYEQASTVMQVQRDIGQRGVFYRDSKWAKGRVEKLDSLQAESTLRCF